MPAVSHQFVYAVWTVLGLFQSVVTLQHSQNGLSSHALVRSFSIGHGFPEGNPKAPNIRLRAELEEVDTLWSVPLQGPLAGSLGLHGIYGSIQVS